MTKTTQYLALFDEFFHKPVKIHSDKYWDLLFLDFDQMQEEMAAYMYTFYERANWHVKKNGAEQEVFVGKNMRIRESENWYFGQLEGLRELYKSLQPETEEEMADIKAMEDHVNGIEKCIKLAFDIQRGQGH